MQILVAVKLQREVTFTAAGIVAQARGELTVDAHVDVRATRAHRHSVPFAGAIEGLHQFGIGLHDPGAAAGFVRLGARVDFGLKAVDAGRAAQNVPIVSVSAFVLVTAVMLFTASSSAASTW